MLRLLKTSPDPLEPRWKLLAAAQERLDCAATLDEVIAIVRGTARAVTSADGVTFVLREQGRCYYVEEDAIAPLWKGQHFPMETCISGWCMLHAKTAVIPDVFVDPRIPHGVYRRTFVQSLVIAPVSGTTPVAAIGAYWAEKRMPSPREIEAVERLAFSVGGAMDRAAAA